MESSLDEEGRLLGELSPVKLPSGATVPGALGGRDTLPTFSEVVEPMLTDRAERAGDTIPAPPPFALDDER